ncbi:MULTISPECIES: helix-hairpin-helix domain-containing protein [Burkholderiaceae]|uniref:ComEA family DNA-binding protein n=1 Tax=Burkholderiaceae TaxID=119060 RepID=UPI00095A1081|nr:MULTISPECIES: helix-hairpin-helix domain-containing protein [Burkholderiaceae]MCF2133137.1 helix-hairpin-helix domain-containing protein [Mycetohabitans sp. B3]MCG1017763.1 helix-hairpin-helix domain-containing protein [Mycetohabitans sp. B4]MCG1038590.1 helix-hairpin-helix domain-containing protein [Mycetohabitans sp. B7]SIT68020.1 competence protein ComEA [Burkholderia sp. b13]SIT80991.1 competence protein ComEA [Burkholderia sp. b14]
MGTLLNTLNAPRMAVVLWLTAGLAAASPRVQINAADDAMLQTIRGIGPSTAQAIIEARDAQGPFSSANDLVRRVKRVGAKSVAKWQAQGLVFDAASPEQHCAPAAASVR